MHASDPGRTSSSTMEASVPLPAVVVAQPALIKSSRSNIGVRGLQLAQLENSLNIYYQNIRGLHTKIEPFYLAVSDIDYDLLIETWRDDSIFSSQLFASYYNL